MTRLPNSARNWGLLSLFIALIIVLTATISQANEPPLQPLFGGSSESPLIPPA